MICNENLLGESSNNMDEDMFTNDASSQVLLNENKKTFINLFSISYDL
jgi:hypothetical protein